MRGLLGVSAMIGLALGCGDGEGGAGGAETGGAAGDGATLDGESIYRQPLEDGNTFACATCHALEEPADDGLRRPGHPIGDAAARPSYKNGALTDLRDAVNTCVEEWMVAEPLAAEDPRWLSLAAFLEERAGDAVAEPIEIAIVEPPRALDGGDSVAGMETFDGTCAVCHGAGAAGTERAPSLIGSGLGAESIARRVRTSGRPDSAVYDGLTGGVMPFWGADRLGDRELLDVIAYVEEIGRAEREEVFGDSGETGESGCDAVHPLVGKTAALSGFAHDVAGVARVVDDCTITIEDFHFDGGGIDVQVYAGLEDEYDPPTGFSLSENLLGQVFEGDTLTVRIPEGRSLDELDGISIWCVTVGASFGDGRFE